MELYFINNYFDAKFVFIKKYFLFSNNSKDFLSLKMLFFTFFMIIIHNIIIKTGNWAKIDLDEIKKLRGIRITIKEYIKNLQTSLLM